MNGPHSVLVPTRAWRAREPVFRGTIVALVVDGTIGADMYGGIIVVEPGATIHRHWHPIGEWQFVLEGEGLFIDAAGAEAEIVPMSSVFSPPGPSGAHGFRNTGPLPLKILFVYPSPGGERPDLTQVDQ
jgi:oxalate decarboxylase/phosphoglucose isomerase-like protein (cupin superfamily)